MSLPMMNVPKFSLIVPSSKKEIEYRPFLVKEERIILMALENKNEIEILRAIKEAIRNCTFEKLDAESLSSFDIEYIFLKLRAKSKGEFVKLNVLCSAENCNSRTLLSVNIDNIAVTIPEGHTTKISLSDNIGIMMKYPNPEIVMRDPETSEAKKVFNAIILSIDGIYNNTEMFPAKDYTKEELGKFLDNLSQANFEKINNFFETMPYLKHDIVFNCKKCNTENKYSIEGLRSFLD